MTLRAKVRGQWRNISPAMARVFRRRGREVIDTEAVAAPPPPVLPPAAVIDMPGVTAACVVAEIEKRERAASARPVIRTRAETRPRVAPTPAANATVRPNEPPVTLDLTDDELDELTKPER